MALRAAFPPGLPPVRADLGLIERVLDNLLDNALRHTPEGGSVEVALSCGAPAADTLQVSISDSGPGIAPALREGLFQRPFTVGGARRGGGLGLRIVHRILELHGQPVALVDQPGRGACLRFALPVDGRLEAAATTRPGARLEAP